MELKQTAESLSDIEKKTLKALEQEKFIGLEELSKKSNVQIDSTRRAIAWLEEKDFVELEERKESSTELTERGKEYALKGLPEENMLKTLQGIGGVGDFPEVMNKAGFSKEEFNFALGYNKKKNFISILPGEKPRIQLTGVAEEIKEESLQETLKKIESGEKIENEKSRELETRGLVKNVEKTVRKAKLNSRGIEALKLLGTIKQRAYNIQGKVPELFIGKKQPYMRFLLEARRKLAEIGFIEMESPLIVSEFYNFDALFQPQGHPARQWSDTYQLKRPKKGELPDKKIVERVKATHENGWKTGSKGWQYTWSAEIAKRLMPTAHCTAHSARQLAKGVKVPGKYFAVARCYRPDVVDARHLIEFNQMEGIIIDESMNFRKLLGMLKQFAVEFAGTDKVKFAPDYFPFTEPSCELQVKHPKLGWVELGGSGIFRPELALPLGIKEPVLAWGIGIDRLAMVKLGIKDIRQLFSDDLNWLRNAKVAQ
ncbi:MAG: phenylalanine--tRNA ligase subunit alpha [Candidatus Diapherotrites archaeon]|nr:phenylalanine--tRNA ligase subunit alpha [Candidatus Diapherotrites archaeon]